MSSQKARLQHRQATAAAWAAANPVLLAGELGFETDTKILRVGDGISTFTSLTPIGTLQQMGAQPVNANLASLAALVLAENKGLYATGAETVAMFDLTAAGRALLDDANAAAQRVTLGLGEAINGSSFSLDDANNATSTGFYTLTSPFTNGPTAAGYRFLTIRANADEMTQIAAASAGGAVWYRTRTGGTWGAWARLLDPPSLKTELNASGAAPVYACRAWVNFNGTGTVAIRGSGNVSSVTDNGTGDYTINFATALEDANYTAVTGGAAYTYGTPTFVSPRQGPASNNISNSACRISCGFDNGSPTDWEYVSVAIFR